MDECLLSIISVGCGQLVKMLITLEPHSIFGSKFAYIIYFEHCQVTGMENGDKALPSIILALRGLLVKMIIILETHHNYSLIKFCIFCKHFNIVETRVCKTVSMVCRV